MSKLEQKWWFSIPVAFIAGIATGYLFAWAGMPPMGEFKIAQWIVFGLCHAALFRALSFSVWLLVLMVSPSLAGVKPQRAPSPHR